MATYYIATDGSDGNPGTDIGAPRATIPGTLSAGDTVYFRAGNYNIQIVATNSGSSGNVITYKAYNSETVRIYGVSNTDDIIKTAGYDYLSFEDLYIEYNPAHTEPTTDGGQVRSNWVNIASSSDSITVKNCTIQKSTVTTLADAYADYNSGHRENGILANGTNVTIDGCYISGINKGIRVGGGVAATNLWVKNTTTYLTVQSGMMVGKCAGSSRGALIENCTFEKSAMEDGIQFYVAKGDYTKSVIGHYIKDCVFKDNGENAIDFKGASRIVIEGCTFYGTIGSNNGGLEGWNNSASSTFGQGTQTDSERVIVRNCVFYDNISGPSMKDREHFKIYNNVIVYNRRDYTGSFSTLDPGAATGFVGVKCPSAGGDFLVIRNNIIGGHAPDAQVQLFNGASTDIDYNYYFTGTDGVAQWAWATGTGGAWQGYDFSGWKTKLSNEDEISGGDVNSTHTANFSTVDFVNVADKPTGDHTAYDFRVNVTSPCYQAGGPLTTATNAGSSSTSLKVGDAYLFSDGMDSSLYSGDTIYINSDSRTISSIDYDAGVITLSSAATWSIGDSVYWGSATPNIGLTDDVGGGTYVIAGFTATPLTGTAPVSVTFTDASSASNTITAYSYERNSGTGWVEFSTSASPASVEFAEGIWSVRLTITTADGTNTKTRTNYIVASADGGTDTPTSNNQISNGDFATGDLTNWKFYTAGTGSAVVSSNECIVNVSATGGNTQLFYRAEDGSADIGVVEGHTYVMRYRCKAGTSSTSELSADVLMDASPYSNLGLAQAFTATTEWQTFEHVFVATASNNDARVRIRWTGATLTQDIYFDDFEFYELAELSVSFTSSATSGTAPLSVTFTDTSTGSSAIAARSWTIGGVEVSTAQTFTYVFGAGTSTVRLIVTDVDGNTATATQNIVVASSGGGNTGTNAYVTRVASNTSGDSSTQTIPLDNLSLAPNFVMLIASSATTDGTAADHARLSVGFYDGSSQAVHSVASKSGEANTATRKIADGASSILILDGGTNTILAEASCTSVSASALELSWSTLPSSAYLITVVAATFDSVAVSTITQPAENATTTVNTLGFTPNMLLCVSAFEGTDATSSVPLKWSMGVKTASYAAGVAVHENSGDAAGAPKARLEEGYALYQTQQGALDLYQGEALIVSGGYSYKSLDNAGLGTVTVVAIDTGSVGINAQTLNTPTSTGSANLYGSALAFVPGLVLAIPTWRDNVDAAGATGATDGEAGAWGIVAATPDAQFSTAWAIEYDSATTDTQSLSDNQFLNLPDHTGANNLTVTGATFGADNVALTWGAVDASARKMIAIAFELVETTGGDINYIQPGTLSGAISGMP